MAARTLCKHCGRFIEGRLHVSGRHAGLMRCDPRDSKLAYGYVAEHAGQPCAEPCVGTPKGR